MNQIQKIPIAGLGHDFIKKGYLPKGRDEYYLREAQADPGRKYRTLRSAEIKSLIANGNTSDNWKNVLVDETFNPSLVQQCRFYGRVRIGKLEPFFLEFHDVRLPIGLYNSSIISCDLGDNVVVNNVSYLSHYIVGNEVILHNVNEIHVSDHAKFGNGIVKEGEKESVRIWLELCNENGGRSIMPFDGMQAGDAGWGRWSGSGQPRIAVPHDGIAAHRTGQDVVGAVAIQVSGDDPPDAVAGRCDRLGGAEVAGARE